MADESGAAVCANPPSQTLAVVRATRQQLWPPGARVPLIRPLGRESLVLATFAPRPVFSPMNFLVVRLSWPEAIILNEGTM